MMRIGITGPESTGKSTLAVDLARALEGKLVPEFAREYLERNGHEYQDSDLIQIAQEQKRLIDSATGDFVICDTEFYVLKIWYQEKFKSLNHLIEQYLSETQFDLIVLCYPDIPWEYDPLRENPNDRDRLFSLYLETIQNSGVEYVVVQGNRENRLKKVLNKLNVY